MNSQTIYMPAGFYKKELTKIKEDKVSLPSRSDLSHLVPSPLKTIITSFWAVLASRIE